ncbi:cell division protein FtsB [uncultured Thiomicrorhabdus sp.]
MRLNLVIIGVSVLCVYFFIRLLIGDNGFSGLWNNQKDVIAIKAELEALQTENIELKQQINALRNSSEGIETLARENLGMIKKNEIFIEVISVTPMMPSAEKLPIDSEGNVIDSVIEEESSAPPEIISDKN